MAKHNKSESQDTGNTAVMDAPSSTVPGIDAKTIELGNTQEFIGYHKFDGLDKFIQRVVVPKHPDKFIAWVDREHVAQRFRGWQPLRLDYQKQDAEVVDMDSADKTQRNVLAWQDIRIHKAKEDEEARRRAISNRFVAQQGTKAQADEFNAQGLGGGDVFAEPLSDRDFSKDTN